MKKDNPDRSCVVVSLAIVFLVAVIFGAYALGRFQGNYDVWSQISSKYIAALSKAEEREERIMRDQTQKDGQTPIEPGPCILTIFGPDTTSETQGEIVRRDGDYFLRSNGKKDEDKISSDGRYFAWETTGYGHDRMIGTIHNGKVVGRLFYWHGGDIGLEHFEITVKEPTRD